MPSNLIVVDTRLALSSNIILPKPYSLGTYITVLDNGENPSFFGSNFIRITGPSGYRFYGGSQYEYIRSPSGSLTFVAGASNWRLVNSAAYVTSGDAVLSNISTTNLFLDSLVASNLLVEKTLTVTGAIDVQRVPTIQGIPVVNTSNLVSTVDGLGTLGFISSVSVINEEFVSTVKGLGGYGYISSPQLLSTVAGLGSNYVSSSHLTSTYQGLGTFYLSTPSLTSTVQGLGRIYLSTLSIVSTVDQLGQFYISTASLQSTVRSFNTITSSNHQSTFTQLGLTYVSSLSLVSSILGISNVYISPTQFTSTVGGLSVNYESNVISTVSGLGNYYISSLSLYSTVGSIVLSNQSAVSVRLSTLSNYISSLSLFSTIDGLGTFGYISLAQLTSTTRGIGEVNSRDLQSTVLGLGSIYVSSAHLVSTNSGISNVIRSNLASTVAGLGSNYLSTGLQSTVAGLGTYGYISLAQLASTTSNLELLSSSNIISTITGLGSLRYISLAQVVSTVNGFSDLNRSNLISTVNTLGCNYISSLSLQSTVAGLGAYGYISLAQLTSTTSNLEFRSSSNITSTITGLGSLRYISLAQVVSTVSGFSDPNRSNLISTVNTLGCNYISSLSLQSTVAGLGTYGYISLSQLTSTTAKLQGGAPVTIVSTVNGLGSLGYISFAQVISTVTGFSNLNRSNLISTVNTLGCNYISTLTLSNAFSNFALTLIPSMNITTSYTTLASNESNLTRERITNLGTLDYISLAHLTSTVIGFSNINRSNMISTVNTLGSNYISSLSFQSTIDGIGRWEYIFLSNLTSTTLNLEPGFGFPSTLQGLGLLNYISVAHLTSTVIGFSNVTRSNLLSTVNTLGSTYISSPSLQSTVRGLGNSYISTPSLVVASALPPPTVVTPALSNTMSGLGGIVNPQVSTLPIPTGSYLAITYTSRLIIYSEYNSQNIYTNSYSGTAQTVLHNPGQYCYGLACDGTNVYASVGNKLISISLASGTASLLAGADESGYVDGNELNPASIRFNGLASLSLDPTFSNLYICDNGNGRLRRLRFNPFSVATIASISPCEGVAVDSTFAYITGFNAFIQKVRLSDGDTTALGTFKGFRIALDSTKPVAYVTTERFHTINTIDLTTGAATLLAGTGSAGTTDGPGASASFTTPFSLIFNQYDSSLYVTEIDNRIRRITLNTTAYTSSLTLQASVANLGTYYISTSSLISTVNGLGTFGYLSTGYLISTVNNFSNLSNVNMTPFVSTTNGLGNTYISTSALSITPDTYSVTTFASMNGFTYAMAIMSNYIFYSASNTIYRNTFAGNEQTTFFTSNVSEFNALACDASNVYAVAIFGGLFENRIISISMAGVATYLANPNNTSGNSDGTNSNTVSFNSIIGLSLDPTQKFLYICDSGNKALRRLQINPFSVTTVATFVEFPQHVTVDSLGRYAYLIYSYSNLYKVDLFQPNVTTISMSLGSFTSLSIDRAQTFAYGVSPSHAIYTVNLTTGATVLIAGSNDVNGYADGNGSSARFNSPIDIAYNPYDSFVYIADRFNQRIRKLSTPIYGSTIQGLTASQVVQRITASNSTLYLPATSNFVTSASVLSVNPTFWLDGGDPNGTGFVPAVGSNIELWYDKRRTDSANVLVASGTYSNGIRFIESLGTSYVPNLLAQMSNQTVFVVFNTTSLTTTQPLLGTASGLSNAIQLVIQSNTMQVDLAFSLSSNLVVQTLAGVYNNTGYLDGSNALFNDIAQLAVDASGNIFVADSINHAIRKITNGVVSTYAGFPSAGSNDGTVATARFNLPRGVAVDSSGIVYVSDSANNKIRKIVNGIVTTIAGSTQGYVDGPGTSAKFNTPYNIAVDSLSNIYICDTDNHVIRRIDSSSNVTTFAGSTVGFRDGSAYYAQFNRAVGIACDSLRNVYVADYFNHRIRKITPFILSDLNYNFGSEKILQMAVERDIYGIAPSSTFIYFVNGTRNIFRLDTETGNFGIAYTLSSSTHSGASGIGIARGGDIYVSDESMHTISAISSDFSSVTIVAGTSGVAGDAIGDTPQFNRPTQLYCTSTGAVEAMLVIDSGNKKIKVMPLANEGILGCFLAIDQTYFPSSFVFSPTTIHWLSGDYSSTGMYICIGQSSVLIKINVVLNGPTTVNGIIAGSYTESAFLDGIGSDARFQTVHSVTLDGNGNLCVAEQGRIRIIDSINRVSTFHILSINSVSPSICIVGNSLYIGGGSSSISSLLKIPLPVVTTLAGSNAGFADGTTTARFNSPTAVTVDNMDNIYVADTNNYRVRKITAGVVSTIAGSNQAYIDGLVASARFSVPWAIVTYSNIIYVGDTLAVRSILYVPNRVSGGSITANTNTLFTSVVQLGANNGVTGYLNGSLVLQGSIVGQFVGTGNVVVGANFNPILLNANFFVGSIKEIIIYNTALTDTQRQSVEFYLNQKWIQPSWQASYAGKSNTTTQAITLQNNEMLINGNLYASNLTAATFTAQGGLSNGPNFGFYYGDGLYLTTSSDRRLKEHIRPIEHALEKVSSMQAVRYRLTRDPSQPFIGYVAQDLQPILPEVVRTDPNGWMSIQYANLPGLIIEAVKELKGKYEHIRSILSTSTSI